MTNSRPRRRFLQITVVGAGLAGAASLYGANQASAVTSGLTALTHPGVLRSRADLDRMRSKVAAGAEPWLSGYNVFRADPFSSSSYVMAGGRATVTRDPAGDPGNTELWRDCNAAYQNAIMWYITRDSAHAAKALQIIKSWTNALQEINGKDAELAAGIYGAKLATAVEVMHYTGPSGSWSTSELAATVAMFKNIFVPLIKIYGDGGYGLMGMMQIAVACNDLALFDSAYNAFMTHGCCGLTKLIRSGSGQSCESGRDQAHTHLVLAAVRLRVHGEVQPRQQRPVRRHVRAVRHEVAQPLRPRVVPEHLRDRVQPLRETCRRVRPVHRAGGGPTAAGGRPVPVRPPRLRPPAVLSLTL
ncbi:hypothetical protein [Streptomyces sp. A30]|uniref:hypothetical protein n=1 Tax=Streptomyces sp. A30 TaxID=2789273 RepID=UPI003980ED6D